MPELKQAHPLTPPDTLWIYSFQGRFSSSATDSFHDFLGTWVEEDLSFLFFIQPAEGQIRDLLKVCPQVQWLDSYQMSYTEWIGGKLLPFNVGRIHIHPVWFSCQAGPDMESIALDPGVVFGGGTHQTTLDCLKALNFIARDQGKDRLLDLGSGTGILALAAAKLGWTQVVAVDLNPLAAWTTKVNVQGNKLVDQVVAVQGRAEDILQIPAHTVVANIHFDIMIRLVHMQAFWDKPRFVLSGLLRSQAMTVLEQLKGLGALVEGVLDDGTWFTLVGRQQSCNERT